MGTKKTNTTNTSSEAIATSKASRISLVITLFAFGGIAVGAGAFYFLSTKLISPPYHDNTQEQNIMALQSELSEFKSQLSKIDIVKAKSKEKNATIREMASKINSLESQLENTSIKMKAVEDRVQADVVLTAQKAQNIIAQLDKTERRLKRLNTQITAQTQAFKKAQLMWASAAEIRTSFSKGQAFGEHYDTLLSLAENDPELRELIRTLAPFKDKEPPTLIELIEAFKKIESRLIQSSIAAQDSMWSRLKGQLSSIIIIRKKGYASQVSENDDTSDIINAVQTSLRRGNVEQALLNFEKLEENTRVLATEWAERTRLFLDVQGTIQQINSDVITSFSLSQAGDQ